MRSTHLCTEIHDNISIVNRSIACSLRSTLRSVQIDLHFFRRFVRQSSMLSGWTQIDRQSVCRFVRWCQNCTLTLLGSNRPPGRPSNCKNLVLDFSAVHRWVDLVFANFEKVRKLLKIHFNSLFGQILVKPTAIILTVAIFCENRLTVGSTAVGFWNWF